MPYNPPYHRDDDPSGKGELVFILKFLHHLRHYAIRENEGPWLAVTPSQLFPTARTRGPFLALPRGGGSERGHSPNGIQCR